jgi:hypothetical protein
MIDSGQGFTLVPWTQALEQQRGREVSDVVKESGGIEWDFTRKRRLDDLSPTVGDHLANVCTAEPFIVWHRKTGRPGVKILRQDSRIRRACEIQGGSDAVCLPVELFQVMPL